MEEQLEFEAFTEVDETITTADLDRAVSLMEQARVEYQTRKAASDEAHARAEEAKFAVLDLLERAGKRSYEVDGVGKVVVLDKLKVRFPTALEDRQAFLNWLESSKGKEGLLSYVSVNYNSLNSLYNTEFEEAKDRGEADTFSVPGLEAPQSERSLRFTRSR